MKVGSSIVRLCQRYQSQRRLPGLFQSLDRSASITSGCCRPSMISQSVAASVTFADPADGHAGHGAASNASAVFCAALRTGTGCSIRRTTATAAVCRIAGSGRAARRPESIVGAKSAGEGHLGQRPRPGRLRSGRGTRGPARRRSPRAGRRTFAWPAAASTCGHLAAGQLMHQRRSASRPVRRASVPTMIEQVARLLQVHGHAAATSSTWPRALISSDGGMEIVCVWPAAST